MARKLNILVAGGYDAEDAGQLERPVAEIAEFARILGSEIVGQGHNLLTGCRTDLDAQVAEGAYKALLAKGVLADDVKSRAISYVNQGKSPIQSKYGAISASGSACRIRRPLFSRPS